jgi:hypothetical protein
MGELKMYQYFPEMEHLANFKTYLVDLEYRNRDVRVKNISLKDEFFNKYNDLFERINFIDMLMEGFNDELERKSVNYETLTYEEWLLLNDLAIEKLERYSENKRLKEKIDIDIADLIEIVRAYGIYSDMLSKFFPNFKNYLADSTLILKKCEQELNDKLTIKIQPRANNIVEFIWPNAWYITPNGFLYNTNGKHGHKEGNLIYSSYDIMDYLKNNKAIPNECYLDNINKILERRYITYDEFTMYCNLTYELPTVITPAIEQEIERLKKILELDSEEYDKLTTSLNFKWPKYRISYQPNLITLITGYYAAKTYFYKSFAKLNESDKKPELLEKILDLSQGCLEDILVRYSDFSKIETCEKKITTSSMNGIKEFKLYLEKGWDLYIVPKIIYDKENDEIFEMNFKSYFIDKYFDKELSEYNGKGRVLIRDVNC